MSNPLARILMIAGALIFVVGLALALGFRWPRLPGDIHIEKEGFQVHFPIVTCLLISVILTAASWLYRYLGKS